MAKMKTSHGESGMLGGVRSPMARKDHGLVGMKHNLRPSVAANTTRPGISKKSAPVQSPFNHAALVGGK